MLGRQLLTKSSDPKPREGTETSTPSVPHTGPVPCRQTQNPERGRKPDDEQRHTEPRIRQVVRPKTPRGDGNLHPLVADTADFRESSDPKPREGTETSTPSVPHTGPVPCRQTQNPERGRKPEESEYSGLPSALVVRPKTPRGDGNFVDHHCHSLSPRVVRPKTPRGDGNSRRGMARQAWLGGRQTQNPERGRKLAARHGTAGVARGSSDPKPREGTETCAPSP
ncbi:hypothetical protein P466_02447 [Mycobacterium tuberculosis TKK_03_0018]|nr:hypothetical protein P466_02447 [Mycobacterium tuberculosis TKK_03_0018]